MIFRILGPLEISSQEGRRRRVTPGKQRDLLGLLLLRRNTLVSVDEVVDAVWDIDPPSSARKNTQTYVWRLRKALDAVAPGRLRHEPPGYLIEVGADELDLDLFEAGIGSGQRCYEAGDLVAARNHLRAALGLRRGPALSNTALQYRTCPELAQIDERYLTALETRVQIDLRLGAHADLIPELRKLTIQHPLRERLRCQLMTALYRSGRHVDALSVYVDTDTTLRAQFGVQPGRSLRTLQHAILTGAPVLDDPNGLDQLLAVSSD